MIKADFKRLVLKILGGTATSFQEMTANILIKEEIEQYQVGIVCSWPYIVQKRKEKILEEHERELARYRKELDK